MSIRLDDRIKKIIYSSADNSKLVLKGPAGSGKTTTLVERYRYMVEELKVPSESILVLVLNRAQSLEWTKKCMPQSSGILWRTSYSGFVRDELTICYPLVLKNCSEIKNKSIRPVFMDFESSRFLLAKVIEARRKTRGIFSAVAAQDDRIAGNLASILNVSSMSNIGQREIAERMYNSLEAKDEEKRELFKEADELLSDYRKRCFELGVFDSALAIELYNRYLLKDEQYLESLRVRIQHLLVDNIEECVPVEADLIEFLLPDLTTCMLGYNHEGGIGKSFGGNHQYAVDNIVSRCKVIELNGSHTCSDFMYEFSDMLFDNIYNSERKTMKKDIEVERQPSVELRSEMLERIAERVSNLVREESFKPSDIVILSTYADSVTEAVIGGILKRNGISLKNLSGKQRIIDNPYSQALVTLAALCHREYRITPRIEDIRELMRIIFNTDPVRASVLAQKIYENRNTDTLLPLVDSEELQDMGGADGAGKYNYISSWIEDYINRDKPLPIHEFFHKAFLEIIITPNISRDDVSVVRKLIEAAESFGDVVSRFGMNGGRHFVETVNKGLAASESIFELEESLEEECVFLTTPYAFLSSSLTSRVIILTSISSSNWYPRTVKEITNPHVLSRTWDLGEVYTEEMEERNRTHYLALIIRGIIKRCGEKLITFESDISANGYENSGLLSQYFYEVLGGGTLC